MSIRPAKCYRSPKKLRHLRNAASGHARHMHQQRAYTRVAVTVPDKNYIGAAPALRIRQFNMGNPLLKYDTVADLIVKESIDIRDNAIESVRMTANRKMVKDLGKDFYFMKVRVYPSNLMRENKQAQGAGADRVSQGMTLAFGVPIGRCARVRAGQVIFSVLCFENQKAKVKEALMRANAKFPCKVEVVFHKDIKSLGTLPSKAVEEVVVEVKKEEKAVEGAATAEGAPAAEAGKEAGKTEAGKGAPAGKDAGAAKAPAAGSGKAGQAAAKPAGKK